MSKETSPSRQVAIKTFTTAFQILKDAGGNLPKRELMAIMISVIQTH